MGQARGSRTQIWLAALVVAGMGAAGSAEARVAQRPPKTLTWPQLIQRSDAVALVDIGRPVAKQTMMPVGAGSNFVRHQRNMTVIAVAKGGSKGLSVGQAILVDDPDWKGDLLHHQRCQELKKAKGQAEVCAVQPDKDGLASQLSREPASGQRVVVALKKVKGDWQLAAERAMDTAENWQALQGLLRGRR